MSKFNTLITKLREVFQIDRPDLDFGIYRIMNSRASQINEYLENDLKQKVEASLSKGETSDYQEVESELNDALKNAHALGADPEVLPVVQDLRKKLASLSAGDSEHEDVVFSHLLTFFSRYYESGDYISQRRYKGDTYAIPYAGEEVMLHWANKDQYYIKSGEAFTNYNFKLDDGRVVRFRLVSADTAKDNRKDNDENRCFALIGNDHKITKTDEEGESYTETLQPISSEDNELILHFTYQSYPKAKKQKDLTAQSLETILSDSSIAKDWLAIHAKKPTEKNPTRTILEYHLTTYTAKNSADYFIHKDLGTFLRNELDFYIKNEVMHLDDIQSAEKFADIETSLRMIQCLRSIALDLIRFVAQLEDFQKKLWLKKKCVTETNYIITLDRVPQSLYPVILKNKAQHTEWQQLGFIEKLSEVTDKHLQAHQSLSIDTKHFDEAFTAELLLSIEDFDEQCDGLLLHSENFQALNLLQERYREKVKCVYIDPPYNTGDGDFAYKDKYKASSWCSMLFNRLDFSREFLNVKGLSLIHMDEHEYLNLGIITDSVFGKKGNLGSIVWDKRNPKGDSKGVSIQHEYLQVAAIDPDQLKEENAFCRDKPNGKRMLEMAEKLVKKSKAVSEEIKQKYKKWVESQAYLSGGEKAYKLMDDNGDAYQPVSMGWPNKKPAPKEYFIPLVHPVTKKECGVPERGWRNPPATMEKLLKLDLILFGVDESTIPRRKYLLKENLTESVPSLLYHGSSDDAMFKNVGFTFDNPKPVSVAEYFLHSVSREEKTVILDYFAGSGTTGHAVVNLNRNDNGTRKYILCEMGAHFDTILIPRLKKVVYSSEWKDGKPTNTTTGISHCIKYLRLESYEDTLNNLILPEDSSDLLSGTMREDYLLGYMLDVETQGSLLNATHFKNPFSYQLDIATDSAGATEKKTIDLVETFNYLTGITIKEIDRKLDLGYISITGTLPNGETCCILWRDCEKVDYTELNKICQKLKLTAKDNEYEVIYVNGDHNIPNIVEQTESEGGTISQLKLRQTETEFLEKMFSIN